MKNVALASLILASLSFNAFALPESQPQPLLGELRSSQVEEQQFTPVQPLAEGGAAQGIGALLKMAGLTASTGEANRLIDGGGVRVDGTPISDKGLKLGAGSYVLQVGKRKFMRVTLA